MLSKYSIGLPASQIVTDRIDEIHKLVGLGEFLNLGEYLCLGFTHTTREIPNIVLVSETGRIFELPYTGKDVDFFQAY